MKGSELRRAFLDYFASKGHAEISSSSLVPADDPTLLFSNAGMNQFKDLFLGAEKRSYSRAVTSQKCLRISGKHNDFENVGLTARHHTFFEMLGNFSFGDYFKSEAIQYAWEFVTEVLQLDKNRLWVTVYEEDDDAATLWKTLTDVLPGRVLKMGAEENYWAMGDTGPCGPCSEIHYYMGSAVDEQSEAAFRQDDGTYMEIWNLVFMQFNRNSDGTLESLPNPSIDTGMGLERVAAILQGVQSNYDCDLVRPLISVCEEASGFTYDGSSYAVRDLREDVKYARDVAMRVIADHTRAATFLIADGVLPGSDGRGYVLRRLIRRAVRHGRVLSFKEPILKSTATRCIEMYRTSYPELAAHADKIIRVIDAEEQKFYETLDSGLVVLQKAIEELGDVSVFPGETAFLLHDTYGFPLDLTADALKAYKKTVDVAGFTVAMEQQKKRSREDRKGKGIEFVAQTFDSPETIFLGYDVTEATSEVTAVVFPADAIAATAGQQLSVLVKETPFYAESGGQVGDTGTISVGSVELAVLDTQKVRGVYHVHACEVISGTVTNELIGKVATLRVDDLRRKSIQINHSATHLVHEALRSILGTHVKQAGSRVDEKSSRFDYSHFEAVTDDQLALIEARINAHIRNNHAVQTQVLPLEEAQKTGAVALFGEKYGSLVRVVSIGPDSIEFCGGTHVERSGDIGCVLVKAEGSISSGVRRIECICGEEAYNEISNLKIERQEIAGLLKSDMTALPQKVEKILARVRELERENAKYQSQVANQKSVALRDTTRVSPAGVRVIAEQVDDGADPKALRSMVDTLRVSLGSGIVVLGSAHGDSALLVAGITSDLVDTVDAGKLINQVARDMGGKGGGRKDFAQAGGLKSEQLQTALERFFELVA